MVGWVKTEQTPGRPKWHYFDGVKSEHSFGAVRHISLCGQSKFYKLEGKLEETRHITETGNCRSCAKILKKREQ